MSILCIMFTIIVIKSDLRCDQAMEGLLSMKHRSKALSVMEVRASLRERLSAGHIDLRRFIRSMR